MGDKGTFIVLGEASESDEEGPSQTKAKDSAEAVVVGEASESESEDSFHITSEAFASRAKKNTTSAVPKYNSLLHRKLRESNWKLKENFKTLCSDSIKYVGNSVGEVNHELLTSQILLQESATIMRRSIANCSTRLDYALDWLASNAANLPEFNFRSARSDGVTPSTS